MRLRRRRETTDQLPMPLRTQCPHHPSLWQRRRRVRVGMRRRRRTSHHAHRHAHAHPWRRRTHHYGLGLQRLDLHLEDDLLDLLGPGGRRRMDVGQLEHHGHERVARQEREVLLSVCQRVRRGRSDHGGRRRWTAWRGRRRRLEVIDDGRRGRVAVLHVGWLIVLLHRRRSHLRYGRRRSRPPVGAGGGSRWWRTDGLGRRWSSSGSGAGSGRMLGSFWRSRGG